MLLEAKGIYKRFEGVEVLRNSWIEADAGRIVGLIGPNGAGKSTLLAVLSKFLEPEAGSIVFSGKDITRDKPHEIARQQMVRTFQVPKEFGRLTVLENLLVAPKDQLGESVYKAWFRWSKVRTQERLFLEQADDIIHFLNLESVRNLQARNLSGGQKKLLELGRALMLKPRLLLLDEPFAGVTPTMVDQIMEKLLALREQGLGLIVVEHNMYTIKTLSDVVFVMVDGQILTYGPPSQVFQDPRVLEAYLGRDEGQTTFH